LADSSELESFGARDIADSAIELSAESKVLTKLDASALAMDGAIEIAAS